ncbi:Hypothetical protein D9617_8g048910 [Elsinoe fawcettii]|nr:Hypothetical protein D9617_8g048910 [Elsinoe fawcettii]
MLPPQLRASSSVGLQRPSVNSVRAVAFAADLTSQHATSSPSYQKRTFFRQRHYTWNSHLDPEFHEYQRKRHQRVRAALRDALRRRSKWQMPLPFSRVLGARAASHWSRSNLKRWPQIEEEVRKKTKSEDDYELSPGEKRWKKQMDAVKDYVDANPYRAVFGKPFDPFWSPTMWAPLIPSWARGDSVNTAAQHEAGVEQSSGGPAGQQADTSLQDGQKAATIKPYTQTSSFSYSSTKEPGKAPVIQAKSTNWNSASNEVKQLQYDPISGKMVPVPTNSARADLSSSSNTSTVASKTTKFSDPEAAPKRTETAIELPVKRFVGDFRPSPPALRTSKSRSGPASATASATRPAEERSSTASKLSILPKDDVDLMTADAIRASMGKSRTTRHSNSAMTEADRGTLSKDCDSRWKQITSQIEDARRQLAESKAKSSLQNTKRRGETTLQPALNRMASVTTTDQRKIQKALAMLDGYSKKPMGMQTSFKDEQKACGEQKRVPLSKEISDRSSEGLALTDGYSQEPVGLQKTYENELQATAQQGHPPLEREIADKVQEHYQDDGYTTKPVGLQNTFANERKAVESKSRAPLAEEIVNKSSQEETAPDGYSTKPIGLQSNYAQEREAVAKHIRPDISHEIVNKPKEVDAVDDGYTTKPIGLQSNFTREREAVVKQDRPDIAEEIARKTSEDVVVNDGYSTKPIGLQSNYANERQAVADQVRPDIAQEIVNKSSEDANADDGYTTKPIGLQSTYAKEREEVSKGVRPALADEMERNAQIAVEAQLGLAEQHDDGFTKAPVGLETCYEKEREACARGRQPSLEDELKAMNDLKNSELNDPALLPNSLQFLAGRDSDTKTGSVDGTRLQREAAAKELLETEVSAQKHAMSMYEGRHAHSAAGLAENNVKIVNGEGDIDMNVTKFVNNDKWYKKTNSIRTISKADDELLSDIVRICKENGLMQHVDYEEIQKELKDKVKALETQVKRATQKQDELKMENGNLEAQVRQHMKQQSKLLRTRQELSNENKTLSTKLGEQKNAEMSESALPPTFQWAEPSSYKILAYDPNNSWSSDSMQIVSTTSRFSDNEVPISVPQALSNVSEPTRFVSHFAGLQKEGYQAIHASGNLLVLRKVKSPTVVDASTPAPIVPEKPKPSPSTVNPVDGTVRHPPTETATGNYASPTGFVNHDPVFPIEKPVEEETKTHSDILIEDGVYYRHYPRVRRQEPVFSGSGKQHDQYRGRSRRHERRAAWKRRVKFAFSVGATSAALVYALGVGAELARGEKERQRKEIGA